ncbi:unnamed protein product [Phytomonas sp. EM1]|nr:unnamed protein product [Phytomonas sp. EM1]|eukprot:CCW64000.1 unnamed protein product [Phytomonas sp. isolate EM1]
MLKLDSRRYYGSSETFVFQIFEEGGGEEEGKGKGPAGDRPSRAPELRSFHSQGCNAQYINCRADSIVIGGGGGVSLYIDDRVMHGATSACPTFGSPPLTEWAPSGAEAGATPTTKTMGFDIRRLEVIVMA